MAGGQEGWNDDNGTSAAESYARPKWDDDCAGAEQGGWGDYGDAQVGLEAQLD